MATESCFRRVNCEITSNKSMGEGEVVPIHRTSLSCGFIVTHLDSHLSMHVFRSYTFSWLQIGIFKFAMITIGLAIGAYWHELVREYIRAIVVIAIVTSAYIGYITLQQATQSHDSANPDR